VFPSPTIVPSASGIVPQVKRAAPGRRGRGGFTLLEILLAMAIIALLVGVLVGGSSALLDDRPATINEVFWKSVQEARKCALRHERDVFLRFVDDKDKGKLFTVTDGPEVKSFPLPPSALTRDLMVDFLSTQKGGHMAVLGGVVVDVSKIDFVTFYSDGTCSPFRLQVMRNGAASALEIDPWTCAPILVQPDPYAPKT
jgi:prepilin-type N-terminal cleavage/methylation domain-containing protein